MAEIPNYTSFAEKNRQFKTVGSRSMINTVKEFDEWYDWIKKITGRSLKVDLDRHGNFFRGTQEAKYKLYNSAQRMWITNELSQWPNNGYMSFYQNLVDKAGEKLLLKKVFDFYSLKPNQRDFPLLSILQHYGAPTPLMDWTYNLDVALYFACEDSNLSGSTREIDNYVSVYHINKSKQKPKELSNLLDWSKGHFPQLESFKSWETNRNSIFYISDFESKKLPRHGFKDERPMTTNYNLNILPQEGLFIFSPFPDKPLEDCFNTDHWEDGNNLELLPFACYNIKKDLAEYIRRKIKLEGIDQRFIYPQLGLFCESLVNEFLDSAVRA